MFGVSAFTNFSALKIVQRCLFVFFFSALSAIQGVKLAFVGFYEAPL